MSGAAGGRSCWMRPLAFAAGAAAECDAERMVESTASGLCSALFAPPCNSNPSCCCDTPRHIDWSPIGTDMSQ